MSLPHHAGCLCPACTAKRMRAQGCPPPVAPVERPSLIGRPRPARPVPPPVSLEPTRWVCAWCREYVRGSHDLDATTSHVTCERCARERRIAAQVERLQRETLKREARLRERAEREGRTA